MIMRSIFSDGIGMSISDSHLCKKVCRLFKFLLWHDHVDVHNAKVFGLWISRSLSLLIFSFYNQVCYFHCFNFTCSGIQEKLISYHPSSFSLFALHLHLDRVRWPNVYDFLSEHWTRVIEHLFQYNLLPGILLFLHFLSSAFLFLYSLLVSFFFLLFFLSSYFPFLRVFISFVPPSPFPSWNLIFLPILAQFPKFFRLFILASVQNRQEKRDFLSPLSFCI